MRAQPGATTTRQDIQLCLDLMGELFEQLRRKGRDAVLLRESIVCYCCQGTLLGALTRARTGLRPRIQCQAAARVFCLAAAAKALSLVRCRDG
jgi:hypothetical protein